MKQETKPKPVKLTAEQIKEVKEKNDKKQKAVKDGKIVIK